MSERDVELKSLTGQNNPTKGTADRGIILKVTGYLADRIGPGLDPKQTSVDVNLNDNSHWCHLTWPTKQRKVCQALVLLVNMIVCAEERY